MKCEEAAEFVSALYDGATVPPVAAEHIGACETCQGRLKEYAEIDAELRRVASAELRRVASLKSPEEVRARIWEPEKMTPSGIAAASHTGQAGAIDQHLGHVIGGNINQQYVGIGSLDTAHDGIGRGHRETAA